MRTYYLLFALAAVFFAITAASLVFVVDQTEKNLWVVSTVVVGLFSASLGVYLRPKAQMAAAPIAEAPAPATAGNIEAPAATTATPVAIMPATTHALAPVRTTNTLPVEVTTPAPATNDLTKLRGINAKRAEQLNALGIRNLDYLAKASAEDLATKLTISPRITRMWFGSAKKQKS